MNKLTYAVLLILLLCVVSCENSTESNSLDCEKLIEGLVSLDVGIVKSEMNKLVIDLNPKITANDQLGHLNNFSTLVDRINTHCEKLESKLICYACIETYPPITEISISLDSAGVSVKRVVDILTSSENALNISGVHR